MKIKLFTKSTALNNQKVKTIKSKRARAKTKKKTNNK